MFPHDIVFTHGDLWDHNIMVDQGHINGIVDWEVRVAARVLGVYFNPSVDWDTEPWALRLATLPGYKYSEEMEYDLALITLSNSSFPMW